MTCSTGANATPSAWGWSWIPTANASRFGELNTHSPTSLYQAFAPAEAKRLADRLEVHHTPKHGSWLNLAEIELAALGRQCLARRIAQHDTLCRHVAAWEEQRNSAQTKITWQFPTSQARIKLKSLYPSMDGCQSTKQAFVAYAPAANPTGFRENACLGVVEDASFYLLRVSTRRGMTLR